MYVLRVNNGNEEDLERAIKVLKENGFDVTKDSALKIACFEEACSIIDDKYSHLNMSDKDSLADCLTHELFFNSDKIFDEEYMDSLAKNIVEIME